MHFSGNYLQAKSVINGIECENISEQNEIDNLVELYTVLDTMGTTLNPHNALELRYEN